jgi:hypothetical protein
MAYGCFTSLAFLLKNIGWSIDANRPHITMTIAYE